MPSLIPATPQVQIRLYKSIMRKTGDAGLPVSERYAGKEAFIDLTPFLGDGSSVTVNKSVREPAGAFSITFADRPNISGISLGPVQLDTSLETVYGLVEPQDIVEIRMWNGIGTRPNPLPIKMRGFVTEVSRNRTMGPGGRPQRTVVLSGQDYGKILQTYQILYLPSYTGTEPLLTGYNLYEIFGDQQRNTITGAEFVQVVLEKIINPVLKTLIPEASPMPREIIPDIQVTEGVLNNSYNNTEGAVIDLLNQYLDIGIWNELFIEDREEGVYLVYRPVPAIDLMTEQTIQPLVADPVVVDVPDNYILQLNQSRNDQNVFNYYWCTNQRFDLSDDLYRRLEAFTSGDKTVDLTEYSNSHRNYYGIRAMYGDSNMGPTELTNMTTGLSEESQEKRGSQIADWIASRRAVMTNSNKDNVVLEHGTLVMKGGPTRPSTTAHMKPGDYVNILDGRLNWLAYAVTLQDTFVPFQSYITSITFERGTGFAMRVSEGAGRSPWLAEQATRQSNKTKGGRS